MTVSLMLKTSINTDLINDKATHSAIESVAFSSSINLSLNEKVVALQTTRLNPVNSNVDFTSAYQGFNLGLHVGDDADQVNKNRIDLQTFLPPNTKIQWLEQIHGCEVAQIAAVTDSPIIADAAFTKEKNICLAVMTADCLPILLTSKQGDEIAAIHGGWRPLAANVITNTVQCFNTKPHDIYAWLGPCIGPTAFEVGQEVKDTFIKQNPIYSQAFKAHVAGKYFANLQQIAQIQLSLLGIEVISTLPECTYSSTDKYYSFRKNATTGRMATLICRR